MVEYHEFNNNESVVTGVVANSDGTFTALTFANSKTFKTLKGAQKWFKRNGGDNDD